MLNIIQQTHTLLAAQSKEDLKGRQFSPLAYVVAVADMFDQLTAMNLHHAPVSEIAAIRQLRKSPDLYDTKTVSALARSIRILPSGCSIDLSTGDKGIVLMENPDNFMAPVILNFRDNQIYDLNDPKIAKKMQIADIMKTMDNRIVIDEDTLKQFTSDDRLKDTLDRYHKAMQKKRGR